MCVRVCVHVLVHTHVGVCIWVQVPTVAGGVRSLELPQVGDYLRSSEELCTLNSCGNSPVLVVLFLQWYMMLCLYCNIVCIHMCVCAQHQIKGGRYATQVFICSFKSVLMQRQCLPPISSAINIALANAFLKLAFTITINKGHCYLFSDMWVYIWLHITTYQKIADPMHHHEHKEFSQLIKELTAEIWELRRGVLLS